MDKDKAYLMRVMAALTPQFDMQVAYGKADDDYLVELDGFVYISRDEIEVETVSLLGRTTEKVQGFVVSQAKLIRGSYMEPDDVDLIAESEHRYLTDAVEAAVLLLAKTNIQNTLECVGEAMHHEEREALKAQEEQVWDAM